jgi:hypothetical protein
VPQADKFARSEFEQPRGAMPPLRLEKNPFLFGDNMEKLMALNPAAKDGESNGCKSFAAISPSPGGGSAATGAAGIREACPPGHEERRREPLPMEPAADLPLPPSSRAASLKNRYPGVERRENLSSTRFLSDFAAKNRPVVVPNALKHCPALSRWTVEYLRKVAGNRTVKLKQGLNDEGVAGLKTIPSRLNDYLDCMADFETRLQRNDVSAKDRPPYLHDLPLLSVLPEAADDLDGFPSGYFPEWYRADWVKFAQFFLGPSHSLTPLHFDCLLTHNLFFQVTGRKRFILLHHDQLPFCYRYKWRWCEVDAENPDFLRHPLYRQAQVQECIVEPGDMLYMPPGMLHHVRGLDCSMSFNVDWHTRGSAIHGMLALGRGMPIKNVYYNTVIALGQCAGQSAGRVLPWYRSYLNHVS